MPGKDLNVVVMAGGASSRLFPFNKVLSDITGTGRTMLQQAYDRVIHKIGDGKGLVSPDQFYFAAAKEFRNAIHDQIPELPEAHILTEPGRRNTLPAVLWASAHIRAKNPDAILAILTADHVIRQEPFFLENLRQAADLAQARSAIVTLGIKPSDDPVEWTAFGAIESEISHVPGAVQRILKFEEKPALESAKKMIAQGTYVWNSGMFIGKIKTFELAMKTYQPGIFKVYERLCHVLPNPAEAASCFEDFPSKIPHSLDPARQVDNSIDFALMVPMTASPQAGLEACMIPARFSWVDIGSWDALKRAVEPDMNQNVIVGHAEIHKVRNCVLVAKPGKKIRVKNLENHVIVASKEAGLVVPLSKVQEVRLIAKAYQEASSDEAVILIESENCCVRTEGERLTAMGIKNLKIEYQNGMISVEPKQD